MGSIQHEPSRPSTVWGGTPDWAVFEKATHPSAPSSRFQSDPATVPSASTHPDPAQPTYQDQAWQIQPLFQNPWLTYEAIVAISQGQSVFLARHRESKAALVNIHLVKQPFPSVKPLLETICRFSHPSFLGLVGCYCWEDQVFLVWEPVELSVSHILASRCTITEGEIAAIVRPVLEGIQYLRGRGRALAALSADTMLLTESGGVKIGEWEILNVNGWPHGRKILTAVYDAAGMELSCQIDAAEMDAATLKLFALAEVVERLIMKNPPQYPWSAEARRLPEDLKRCISPEELLRVSLDRPSFLRNALTNQSNFFGQVDEGELKMLVNAANKTAYHNLESFKRI
ncbi:unnamed protein product [Penicillium olsonii]|nr:unnamed protein product [Penicillium olsonii]CAG7934142.1 unnamed protein product [Penicillium olsonii]